MLLLATDGVYLMQASGWEWRGIVESRWERPGAAGSAWERPGAPGSGWEPKQPPIQPASLSSLSSPCPSPPSRQIPRKVDHAFLSPGNRAELLVKCSGAAGKRYALRAQARRQRSHALRRRAGQHAWLWAGCPACAPAAACDGQHQRRGARPLVLTPPSPHTPQRVQAPQLSPFKCDLGGTPNAFVQDTLATIVLQAVSTAAAAQVAGGAGWGVLDRAGCPGGCARCAAWGLLLRSWRDACQPQARPPACLVPARRARRRRRQS